MHRINFMYLAHKDDYVDKRLADFINKSDPFKKAKCLFVRESEGVYSYFKKKVFMKNEGENLVIRVGGGYMSIDEFIEQNHPFEQWRRQSANTLRSSQNSASNLQAMLHNSS